jgi:mono/diheme cytochrome c family protein
MSQKDDPVSPRSKEQTRLGTGTSALSAPVAADESEPTAERRPISVLLIGLLIALLYWGDMYVMEHGADVSGKAGSFPPVVYDPFRSYAEVERANPRSPIDEMLARGRRNFEMMCAPCHQPTGSGNPATGIPPLAGSEWVLTEGPGRMIRIIMDSVTGEIEVKGQKFNNPQMPPWRDLLNDEDLAALVSYVRFNKEWGNNAPVVKPEKVKEIRAATGPHAGRQWTAPELLQVPPTE